MSVLSGQTIRQRIEICQLKEDHQWKTEKFGLKIEPFESVSKQALGMSYGLSVAGYDIRVGKIQRTEWVDSTEGATVSVAHGSMSIQPKQHHLVQPGEFLLMSSLERVKIPNDLICFVHDKSTLARQGLALQNTVLEPGWQGYITLELSNHGPKAVRVLVGQPIAQLVFHTLDRPAENPYQGKYQNQPDRPVDAIFSGDAADTEHKLLHTGSEDPTDVSTAKGRIRRDGVPRSRPHDERGWKPD